MKYKFFLLFFICSLSATSFYGQQQRTPAVRIGYEVNISRDTILFFVNKDVAIKNGTLMFAVSANEKSDTFFFPVLDSSSLFALAIPSSYTIRNLQTQAYFYPKLFEIKGTVVKKIKNKDINAILITNNKRFYNKTLQVSDQDEFSLPGLVFQDKATLVFAYQAAEKKRKPSISIRQTPKTPDFKEIVFRDTIRLLPDTVKINTDLPVIASKKASRKDSSDFNKFSTLNNVTVVGQRKSRVEKFNEENSTGLFNDADERLIDCLDNDNILSYPDCLSFLQSRVPGLMMYRDRFGESSLRWRGRETEAFFIDEIPVDLDQLLAINVADIAIVKAYPPPFFGATGSNGDGGGIAIYTRKGEYMREGSSDNKWLFEITGYSPAIHTLSL